MIGASRISVPACMRSRGRKSVGAVEARRSGIPPVAKEDRIQPRGDGDGDDDDGVEGHRRESRRSRPAAVAGSETIIAADRVAAIEHVRSWITVRTSSA